MIQIGVENEQVVLFHVTWVKTLGWSIQASLAGGFEAMESGKGVATIEEGELVETTKAGHRMIYQYYATTTREGDKLYGIVASFYCDRSKKGFVLMTIDNTISGKLDVLEDLLLEDFQRYLDSFVCH